MDAETVPAGADALAVLESAMASLAATDPAGLPDEEKARRLRVLERVDAIGAAVRGRVLEALDAQDGHLADGLGVEAGPGLGGDLRALCLFFRPG